jgi:hypothetical protein
MHGENCDFEDVERALCLVAYVSTQVEFIFIVLFVDFMFLYLCT